MGKLLEGKTPKQAAKLRILDPACGSGSFLIGAYQYLLDWYRDCYLADGPKPSTAGNSVQGPDGEWRLTTGEKKRVLLANIYGVDIDSQAVETTKLSLLLKVLEGETVESINSQLTFLHERALPDLAANIKCGNSLIGPDFYDDRQLGLLLDADERHRINVFDWQAEFPEILGNAVPDARRGFDAVIGNPPYIRIQNLREYAPREVEFYKSAYLAAGRGNYNIYVVFVERGLSLLGQRGRLGFILPTKFFATDYGAALRDLLRRQRAVEEVVDFGHGQVFGNATTYTCLLFLTRAGTDSVRYVRALPSAAALGGLPAPRTAVLGAGTWLFLEDDVSEITDRLLLDSTALLDLPTSISRGSSTGDDDVFCLKVGDSCLTTREGVAVDIETDLLKKPLWATDFTRYALRPRNDAALIFPYRVTEAGYSLIPEDELGDRWPRAYAYLRANKARLEKRRQHAAWYAFSAPRNLNVHQSADLLVPLLADRGLAAPLASDSSQCCLMASGGFSIRLESKDVCDPLYILGLINSKLLFWYLRLISNRFRGGWITCTKQYFGTLPIRIPNLASTDERARHDALVGLVARRVSQGQTGGQGGEELRWAERDLTSTERQIDHLVYEIYGLSNQDTAVIEGGG